ncbi:uncharacterized protein C16orf96 homolog [Pyxicephalus adspersus]|uniref:DUF4795 domain-containing protein n=1 Tax=Pyxicephalus adspersus TaxID=30357 RepID=A0AAV3A3Z5_PYXAD|nr:TPA: hypothetical protein GDO54_014985 [Pyxicephalus adspersus]
MSSSVSLKELLNLSIGSPELGAVNFNALHSLLHGLLEHLQVGDVRRKLSPEEREFIQPGTVFVEDAGRPSTLFHQLQEKVSKMEARLLQLDSLPSSASLLQGSQSQNKPVEEMWQLMQLKKRMEVNENGVNKVMSAFQDLLSTFNSLQQANNMIQDRLASLNDLVTKINIREVERRLQDLEGQTHNIPLLMDKMDSLQKRLHSYPEAAEMVTWPSLHDALTDKSSDWALSNETKQRNVKKVLNGLGTLGGRHEELQNRVQTIEDELKRLDLEIGKKGVPDDLLQQLHSLRQDMEKLLSENKKHKVDMKALQNGLHELNLALQKLETKTDKLAADLSETATFQSQLDELEKKKLNREELMLELNLKADKRALETKVGHTQLEAAIGEVNAVLEDLIKKLALQESEWQNMLAKLFAGLEAKLSRSDLDSIHKDLEELWRFLKKHLQSGQSFDPDGAAGSRKRLFERVKCISCDRPVSMATGPHLVTVRTAPLIPRNRPQSAEFGKDKSNGDLQQVTDPEFQYTEALRPHTACSLHRKTSRSQNLTTVFPYGDPGQIQYKNSEFDLMGINGVMYKGRIDASFTYNIPEREAAVKTPQPPYRTSIERARSANPHFRSHSASNTRTPNPSLRASRTTIQVPSTLDTSPPTFHVPSVADTDNLFQHPLTNEEQSSDP